MRFFIIYSLLENIYYKIYSMEQIFITSLFITISYFILKLIDVKFLSKKEKPMKEFIKESFFVYISSLLGIFVYNKLYENIGKTYTNAYIGNPNF